MLKVAVASEEGKVTQHFGYCQSFNLYEIENGKIINHEVIANPGHKPGFLPRFLNDLGVNVIVSGGMGGSAVDLFNANNIEVIIGVNGKVEDIVNAYISGELKSTGSVCHQHDHHDEC